MAIKSLQKIKNLEGKTVFLRVDFNVPSDKGRIKDDFKIRSGLKTLNFLLAKKCQVILATHWGSPKGRRQASCSTKTLAAMTKKIAACPLKFIPSAIGPDVQQAAKKLKPGTVLFLENLRFYKGELENDTVFAGKLASLADIYINDAFAVSHRAQASVSAIQDFLPSYAGLLLEEEINNLNKVLKPKKPLMVFLGGSKISTKLPLINSLYKKADKIILGGGLANNFLAYQGKEIGSSIFEKGMEKELKKFFKGKTLDPKIILPVDVVIYSKGKRARAQRLIDLKSGEAIFDIGPESLSLFATYVKRAKTIVWNGPMGKFEEASFKHGTLGLARLIASKSKGPAYGLVGGGETVEALKITKMEEYVDWVSTAGGAMLSYLAGADMPGLKKIV